MKIRFLGSDRPSLCSMLLAVSAACLTVLLAAALPAAAEEGEVPSCAWLASPPASADAAEPEPATGAAAAESVAATGAPDAVEPAPAAAPAVAADSDSAVAPPTKPTPAKAGGMRVYIDPETGEFTTPPPGVAVPAPRAPARPAPEMVESEIPGGGVMIDVSDRLRVYSKARLQEDGRVEIECESDPSLPSAAEAECASPAPEATPSQATE